MADGTAYAFIRIKGTGRNWQPIHGLDSWQTSRQPAPAARENFQQRHLLTQGTIAYATRLITR